MKHTSIILAILFAFNITLFSQIKVIEEKDKNFEEIEIGEIRQGGRLFIKCVLKISKTNKDSFYTFIFENGKYPNIVDFQSFSFKETGNDFETLYKNIETTLTNKEKKEIELQIPEGLLTLKFDKALGTSSMQILLFSNGILSYTGYYTLKQYKKLFGRN